MVGYPDRNATEALESFCGGICTHPARWCSAVECIYKKILSVGNGMDRSRASPCALVFIAVDWSVGREMALAPSTNPCLLERSIPGEMQ